MIAPFLLTASVLLVMYVLVGYPLLLRGWRNFGPSVRKDPNFTPTVTAVLAVYNGEAFVGRKIENLLSLDYPADLLNIIIVSDGSDDATDSIVQSYGDRRVRLVRVPHGGKPAALNAALPYATGEILLFADVRQTFDAQALRHLASNFADPSIGCVTGELRFVHTDRVGEAADIDVYWRYEIWARQRHSLIDSIFNTTGCIYALRRSLAEPVPPDTLADDAIIPLRAFFRGYRVVIDSEALAYDYGLVKGGEFRRKMRTLGGGWQAFVRIPQLFTSANRMRMHFLPHKFGRVALPWLLLIGIGATLALPDGAIRSGLLLIAFAFLALAGIDVLLPKSFPLRRITSPARSFVVLNAASLLSVLVFFVPAKRLWKPTRIAVSSSDALIVNHSQNKS
ncbi:MAG TPA: glycosyltransferase family 2 protein [Candidatus Bathyarchaeia archaeon]|nr:glycosyltransferase family 2 protein [Candidatus Bathyarchaeia archaeon]